MPESSRTVKSGQAIIICGIIMIITGSILFYSISGHPTLDDNFRLLKHGGTFTGLMGVGVLMAGILLYLIGREQVPLPEDYEGWQTGISRIFTHEIDFF